MQPHTSTLPKPHFRPSDRSFQLELNQRVSAYFRHNQVLPKAPASLKVKAAFLYVLFFGIYLSFFLVQQNFYSVVALACSMVAVIFLLGMNVMHECAHGTYFKNSALTKLSYCTWDFFGISGDLYRLKHQHLHHDFTNITAWDGDMDLSYPLLRFNPNRPLLPRHRKQNLYALPLYSLLTLSWIFFSDFSAISSKKICNYPMKPLKKKTLLKIFVFKGINIFLFLVLPSLYFPFWKVLGTFLFVQMALGILFSLIFQVAHLNEKVKFVISETGNISNDFAIHQLATTSNFATGNAFWRFALGGLNFQVEHHLFPSISHVYHPELQKIVRQLCTERDVPYLEFSTFREAIASHFRFLKKLGQTP